MFLTLYARYLQNHTEDDDDNESIDGLSPEDCQDESPWRIEWLRQKSVEMAENKYLDHLMSLPGLEEGKAFFLHAKAKHQAATRRETSLHKENCDVVFMGNEGTGKSMLARLYAGFLVSMGFVKPTPDYKGVLKVRGYDFSKTSTIMKMENHCEACGGCVSPANNLQHSPRNSSLTWD